MVAERLPHVVETREGEDLPARNLVDRVLVPQRAIRGMQVVVDAGILGVEDEAHTAQSATRRVALPERLRSRPVPSHSG